MNETPYVGLSNSLNPKEIKSAPAIPQAMESLEKTTQSLHGLFNQLESRLDCVLKKELCPDINKQGEEIPPNGLAECIRRSDRNIQKAVNRVQELLRLLEL